jgi:hypothetical protein
MSHSYEYEDSIFSFTDEHIKSFVIYVCLLEENVI